MQETRGLIAREDTNSNSIVNFFKKCSRLIRGIFGKLTNKALDDTNDRKDVQNIDTDRQKMEWISKSYLDENYKNDEEYVWYACYGSNINFDRFMYYINGDKTGYYSTLDGCRDKSLPAEERPFIFDCPLYFANYSKRWDGGMAFIDYEHPGKSYGKIYKIKMGQFRGVLEQEQSCKLYDAIIYVDDLEGIPVFSFTASHKLEDITKPSQKYCDVIKKGILDLYDDADSMKVDRYFETGIIN